VDISPPLFYCHLETLWIGLNTLMAQLTSITVAKSVQIIPSLTVVRVANTATIPNRGTAREKEEIAGGSITPNATLDTSEFDWPWPRDSPHIYGYRHQSANRGLF
tara:strand:+ start:914 stop:1228 length:315 start_codon:yes stop_codon:yes gene_type:complete